MLPKTYIGLGYETWGLDMNLNKTKYLCTWGTHNNSKLDKYNETEFCQE